MSLWLSTSALLSSLIAGLLAFSVAVPLRAQNVDVTATGDKAPQGCVEFVGVGTGEFDPSIWQNGTINLVPDHRFPFLDPLDGSRRNIYAPSAVETPRGYRLFYGAWDGIPEGKDRIYCGNTDSEFSEVTDRHSVVLPGSYQHVCNVNAIGFPNGVFHFLATTYPVDGLNKPAFFRSDRTGTNWNELKGEPYTMRAGDLVSITGYTNVAGADVFPGADINGMNVILHEDGIYRMFFGDFKDPNGGLHVYRASSKDGRNFTFEGAVLGGHHFVNDVKKFRVGGAAWYLLGAHHNGQRLSYSVSTNSLAFPPARTLLTHFNAADQYIVALGWVVKGEQEAAGRKLLGVLYGAGPVPSLDQNKIFARWLQKKVVFVTADGSRYEGSNAVGPNRQLIRLPGTLGISGHIEVYREDGVTRIGQSKVFEMKAGQRCQIDIRTDQPTPARRDDGVVR